MYSVDFIQIDVCYKLKACGAWDYVRNILLLVTPRIEYNL